MMKDSRNALCELESILSKILTRISFYNSPLFTYINLSLCLFAVTQAIFCFFFFHFFYTSFFIFQTFAFKAVQLSLKNKFLKRMEKMNPPQNLRLSGTFQRTILSHVSYLLICRGFQATKIRSHQTLSDEKFEFLFHFICHV